MIQQLFDHPSLPGPPAWRPMTPPYRADLLEAGPVNASWRQAAVLILLIPEGQTASFPLMVRSHGSGVHSGQISLPGGAIEAGESVEACAVRECVEELGLEGRSIQTMRRLTPLPVPPSRFVIHPVLARWQGGEPHYRPEPGEVAAVFSAYLQDLTDPEHRGWTTRHFGGQSWRVPCYTLGSQEVWGATAMILAELAAMLQMKERQNHECVCKPFA